MDAKTRKVRLLPSKVETIRLDHVHRNPNQPRQVFNEEGLKDLAANILACGYLIYAILVKPLPEKPGHYEIIAGERRWRALQIAGVEEFEFHVAEEEVPMYLISLIENDNREDLNPVDEAEAFQKCMEEEKMSVMELAKFTGKHWNDIYRALRLLKLPKEVKELIRQGKLRGGQAHNLVQFRDYAKQIELARKLIAGEDPPELDEQMSRTSAHSEAIIEARLPDTVPGLIRRMLRFRRDSNSIKFVIKAYFLSHSIGERIEGWCSFTEETRNNFVAELEKLVSLLQNLLKQIKEMPETKRKPSGAAATAVARKEAAEASGAKPAAITIKSSVAKGKQAGDGGEDATVDKMMSLMFGEKTTAKPAVNAAAEGKPAVPRKTSVPLQAPKKPKSPYDYIFRGAKRPTAQNPITPSHTGTSVPVRPRTVHVPADPRAAVVATGSPKPKAAQSDQLEEDYADADAGNSQIIRDRKLPCAAIATKIVVHILGQMNEGEREFLGRGIISLRIGEGLLAEDVDESVLKSFRYIRAHWHSVPVHGNAELNEFLRISRRLQGELRKRGCTDFDGFIKMLKARDDSPDSVGLGGL